MKKTNKIFTLWGFVISIAIICLLIILTLSLNKVEEEENIKYNKKIEEIETKKYFQLDGKTLDFIEKYNKNTKNLKKKIYYDSNGKKISHIKEYDDNTQKLIKKIYYYKNTEIIDYIIEYDPQTGNKIKSTDFNEDGNIKEIKKYKKLNQN